jgi:uncharacterized protein (DUF934 family)
MHPDGAIAQVGGWIRPLVELERLAQALHQFAALLAAKYPDGRTGSEAAGVQKPSLVRLQADNRAVDIRDD